MLQYVIIPSLRRTFTGLKVTLEVFQFQRLSGLINFVSNKIYNHVIQYSTVY